MEEIRKEIREQELQIGLKKGDADPHKRFLKTRDPYDSPMCLGAKENLRLDDEAFQAWFNDRKDFVLSRTHDICTFLDEQILEHEARLDEARHELASLGSPWVFGNE